MSKAPAKSNRRGPEPASEQTATSAILVASVSRSYGLESPATLRAVAAGLIMRVRETLMRDMDRALGEFGTSNARYQVLAIICRAPTGLQLGEIATRAFVHPTTMTSTIDRLLRDGLIERHADPSDRRGILAVATPKGHALYEKARDTLGALEFGLADVDIETVNTLIASLDKVAVALNRRGAGPANP